jgi:hypothetical protein
LHTVPRYYQYHPACIELGPLQLESGQDGLGPSRLQLAGRRQCAAAHQQPHLSHRSSKYSVTVLVSPRTVLQCWSVLVQCCSVGQSSYSVTVLVSPRVQCYSVGPSTNSTCTRVVSMSPHAVHAPVLCEVRMLCMHPCRVKCACCACSCVVLSPRVVHALVSCQVRMLCMHPCRVKCACCACSCVVLSPRVVHVPVFFESGAAQLLLPPLIAARCHQPRNKIHKNIHMVHLSKFISGAPRRAPQRLGPLFFSFVQVFGGDSGHLQCADYHPSSSRH